jgi:hypothetical protein
VSKISLRNECSNQKSLFVQSAQMLMVWQELLSANSMERTVLITSVGSAVQSPFGSASEQPTFVMNVIEILIKHLQNPVWAKVQDVRYKLSTRLMEQNLL